MIQKRNLTAEERRKRTVDTVINLSAHDDPANITTDKIAKYMSVTQGALFRHFPSKDAIWEAVVDRIAKLVLNQLDKAAASAETPLKALEAMFNAHINFIIQHPGVPRLVVGQLQHSRPTPARRMVRSLLCQYRERIERVLNEALETGELRRDLNVEAAATQFLGTIQGLVMQSLIIGDMSHMVEQAQGAFHLYCHGIQKECGIQP